MKPGYLILFVLLFLLTSCTPGSSRTRCSFNDDCEPGKVCVNTWCENMYWPLTADKDGWEKEE